MAISATPNNLPVTVSRFIGREHELAKVCSYLREPNIRLLTLTGPAGVGKTRLALEVASRLRNDFADGVFFISFESISSPSLVVPAIASTVGIEEISGAPLIDRVLHMLNGKRMLLVLDNLEHLLAASLIVQKLLVAGPYLKILVTSRTAMRLSNEYVCVVTPLDPLHIERELSLDEYLESDAVALFVDRARVTNPDFRLTQDNAKTIASICALLEGLPLAIELAATRMRLFSPDELLTHLGVSQLNLLNSGPRDISERHQTLGRALELSYHLLSEPEQLLFRRLAIFHSSWTTEQAEFVCSGDDLDPSRVVNLLQSLVDHSLVNVEHNREIGIVTFSMLAVIREYAWMLLRETHEADSVGQRFRNYSGIVATLGFFQKAGFRVLPSKTPTELLLLPTATHWSNRLPDPIYASNALGKVLDAEAVISLSKTAKEAVGPNPVIFVVIDRRPTDSAWLQIATLRAEDIRVVLIDDTIVSDVRHQGRERQTLEKHLRRFLGNDKDYYDVRHPVSDRLSFFGREVLASELAQALIEGQSIALFGLRKMGKSSLLNVLREKLQFPVALIDLQAGSDPESVYDRIIKMWCRALGEKISPKQWCPPDVMNAEDPSSIFTAATRSLLSVLEGFGAPARLCVLVDEADLIFPRRGVLELERYLTVARVLRGLAQEEEGRFSFMIAGVDPSINRTSRCMGQQNPFYQFFREIYIPALDYDDCIQMIRNIGSQMGLVYGDPALSFIAEMSGGHPFLARQICSLAFRTLDDRGEIGLSHLHSTCLRFIREPATSGLLDEGGLWGEISNPSAWPASHVRANQAILLKLAQAEPQLEIDLVQVAKDRRACEQSLMELERRAVLKRVQVDSLAINPGIFRNWIRRYKLGIE